MSAAAHALERAFREDRATVLAGLIRRLGDFDLAEEALQDAFAAAGQAWPREGVPENPGGWLAVTARRRAIDRLRRARAQQARAARLAETTPIDELEEEEAVDTAIGDDRLRLIFTCCHPALDMHARVALTLRALGGLSTAEIARAFLVAEPAMGKRIVRAKRKIADAHIPYVVPADHELPDRVKGVLAVIYLIFNEGYAASSGPQLQRAALCEEAIRLGRLVCELLPDDAEALGLLSLMLLTHARRDARVEGGRYVALEDQDRARWREPELAEGRALLERALRLGRIGSYQLQASIAALHTAEEIEWDRIAALYAALQRLMPSPVVALNHAAAVGYADGPAAGLELLGPLLGESALDRYQPLHATHAELLRRAGAVAGAREAYARAIELSDNAVEREELRRRRDALP